MQKGSSAAGGVYDILSGATSDGQSAETAQVNVASLAGLSHSEVAERIADAVNPGNVSLDDAAVREAVADAVSSVLAENEDADVTSLPPPLVEECYVRTLSNNAFYVLVADIGASIQKGAGNNPQVHNDRLKEIKDYMREAYRVQLNKVKSAGRVISKATAAAVARTVNGLVMDVFESYIE